MRESSYNKFLEKNKFNNDKIKLKTATNYYFLPQSKSNYKVNSKN